MRPKRVPLTWFAPKTVANFEPETFPVFTRMSGGSFLYGGPTTDRASVKIAGVPSSDIDDPDQFERRHNPAELSSMIELMCGHIAGLYPDPVRSATFTDLYSDDGHGLTGHHPSHRNIVIAGAYSGRGFKLAPALGESVARLAVGDTVPEISFMAPDRFADAR
jgi:sarcosine oxidase